MGVIEYDAELVFKLFLETLERQLENINILPEVQPVLKKISTSDKRNFSSCAESRNCLS